MSLKFDIELSLEDTLSLYFQGADVWNKFVEENDCVFFNFRDVKWGNYQYQLDVLNNSRKVDKNTISFAGYKFKAGAIDFTGTDFGDRQLDFSDANLNYMSLILASARCYGKSINLTGLQIVKGDLNLTGLMLGGEVKPTDLFASRILITEGNLLCSDAVMYTGDINFCELKICKGNVDFSGSRFGDGDFSIRKSKISGGDFSFIACSFGIGTKYFEQCIFDTMTACFSGTNFGVGIVNFFGSDFSNLRHYANFNSLISNGYSFIFMAVKCAKVTFDFSDSVFENKIIDFSGLDFASGIYNFESCEFHGRVSFSDEEENTSTAQSLSFRKSIFHSTLDIGGINTASIIDLRETKLSTHTTLDNLGFKLARSKSIRFIPGTLKATSKDDASKLRRLKELAETNKNHTAALRFHAAEMRARRWHDMPKLASILDAAFSMLSNYGQSILRPFGAWLIVVIGCGAVYSGAVPKLLSGQSLPEIYTNSAFLDGTLYSLIQTLPVFPISRVLQQDLYSALSSFSSPDLMTALTIFQNLLGVVFLFLIGLGLRNRFRL